MEVLISLQIMTQASKLHFALHYPVTFELLQHPGAGIQLLNVKKE